VLPASKNGGLIPSNREPRVKLDCFRVEDPPGTLKPSVLLLPSRPGAKWASVELCQTTYTLIGPYRGFKADVEMSRVVI
jgi:hypothetical protein